MPDNAHPNELRPSRSTVTSHFRRNLPPSDRQHRTALRQLWPVREIRPIAPRGMSGSYTGEGIADILNTAEPSKAIRADPVAKRGKGGVTPMKEDGAAVRILRRPAVASCAPRGRPATPVAFLRTIPVNHTRNRRWSRSPGGTTERRRMWLQADSCCGHAPSPPAW
jgi:hypothetical protein